METKKIKHFLESKYNEYNVESFVENDPILIPKAYVKKEDIEISAFLTSIIAWGKRPMIIRNANNLMELLENDPHKFLTESSDIEWGRFEKFVHRTFNGIDCLYFVQKLKEIYHNGNIEEFFLKGYDGDMSVGIANFKSNFFQGITNDRTLKHLPNPEKGSAAKRFNMFLRWMVRRDDKGVDFGIWKQIDPSELYLPLDVHTGNVSRKLGILNRKQNDWKAVEEVTHYLRKLDSKDPVKYDFALFGLGVYGEL